MHWFIETVIMHIVKFELLFSSEIIVIALILRRNNIVFINFKILLLRVLFYIIFNLSH